jgi:DNA-binding transcriptional ArsR family regulator
MGHPARIAIIQYLIGRQLYLWRYRKRLPLSQPTVSQHLKRLKNAGLIKGSVEEMLFYCINEDGFNKIKHFFNAVNTYFDK